MEYLYHRDVLAPPVFSNNGENVPLTTSAEEGNGPEIVRGCHESHRR
ncbi:hypothetical protein T01_14592 [Trichinella spiralis]|uniref:Uncharacterized protein n=1 Tax=Trichinella spiralis TaxID=6334 RepID=A0A0V1AHX3_TRISP|nr:hypothetical protein T01_14592 [Trichinella spiralis]